MSGPARAITCFLHRKTPDQDPQRDSPKIDAATTSGGVRRALLLDATERVLVLGLYGWLFCRMLPGVFAEGRFGDLLLLIGEGLVVAFFLVRRRTTEISQSPWEWFIAAAGTCSALLVQPGGKPVLTASVAVPVMLLGLLLQFHSKLTFAQVSEWCRPTGGSRPRGLIESCGTRCMPVTC